MPAAIRYQFTQAFAIPALDAYAWSTDFDPTDPRRMGQASMKREITHITDATILLKDRFEAPTGPVEKQKLIQLYPQRLAWTSIHLTGPNKYSQFLCEITPTGTVASALAFTAIHLEYKKEINAEALAQRLCEQDAATWKLLAKAMVEDWKIRK